MKESHHGQLRHVCSNVQAKHWAGDCLILTSWLAAAADAAAAAAASTQRVVQRLVWHLTSLLRRQHVVCMGTDLCAQI
jgi:hypothetical protein